MTKGMIIKSTKVTETPPGCQGKIGMDYHGFSQRYNRHPPKSSLKGGLDDSIALTLAISHQKMETGGRKPDLVMGGLIALN